MEKRRVERRIPVFDDPLVRATRTIILWSFFGLLLPSCRLFVVPDDSDAQDYDNAPDGSIEGEDADAGPTQPVVCPGDGTGQAGPGETGESIFQNESEGYIGVRDTYINIDSPDENYDDHTYIEWQKDDRSEALVAAGLLRFDDLFGAEPGRVPCGAMVESATLILDVYDDSTAHAGMLHQAWVSWDDRTETWNSFGDGDGTGVQTTHYDSNRSRSIQNGQAGPQEIDVTADIAAWAQEPSSNHGWIVLPSSGMRSAVHSTATEQGEAQTPTLLVEWRMPE
ncbi:MAG: DNRLRE domain-containing protein [Myxococcota bacterium]